jgi:uncharacterized protein (DUF58 family)
MPRPGGQGILARLRSIPEPTLGGRIVLTFLVVAGCFAILLGDNQVLFIACVIAATVLLSGVVTLLSAGRLSIARALPGRVFAGAPFDVRLRVENRSRWRPAIGLGFLDALQVADAQRLARGPILPVLPPGAFAEVSYSRRIHRRGIYTVVNTLAMTRFPFGIFERRAIVRSPARIVVLPALGKLGAAARRDLARRSACARAPRHGREGTEEFHGLREYRAGDNPRHIHWRTSARAGKLVRRVLRDETTEDLHVLLDTCVAGADADARRRSVERAVSCAATLLADAAQRGRRAAVHFPGGVAAHTGTRGGLVRALEALAGVQSGSEPVEAALPSAGVPAGSTALLLSLWGPAPSARRAAAARGVALTVWDVGDPGFGRIFGRP